MADIVDLDILRPEPRKVKLAGHIIDVSYVPCGITFEVDQIVREIEALDPSNIASSEEEERKAFDLSIKLCSTFASASYPEMSESWFRKNASIDQISMLVKTIEQALVESYKGVEQYGKNP